LEGSPVTVEVYADAEEVELLLDGVSIGVAPAGPDHRFRASFVTTYRTGELVAVTRTNGIETGRISLATSGDSPTLRLQVDRAEIEATYQDRAFVDIAMCDTDGVVDRSAAPSFAITLEGAVVRPTGTGAITVRATSDDGRSDSVEITFVSPST
jgi:beta-galactosidase